jgi:hypothetical protein
MTQHTNRAQVSTLCFLTLSLAAACSSPTASSTADAATSPDGATTSSGDGGSATSLNDGYRKATWGSNVTVTYGTCTLTYQSDGLPNHARDSQYAVPNMGVVVPRSAADAHAVTDPSVAQNYNITLNTCPTIQSTTATSLGGIGYMISGADLFNPYEGDNATVALANNFSVTDASGNKVYFVDSGNGHPTPFGQYHYHGLPLRVTAKVDSPGGPSHLLGIALDGFPIYGNADINGHTLTAGQLDECNGITSATPEFPDGVYHYVLLDTAAATSSIRCYKGKPAATPMGPGPGGRTSVDAPDRSGCGWNVALAERDPSPGRRVLGEIMRSWNDSLREPLGLF